MKSGATNFLERRKTSNAPKPTVAIKKQQQQSSSHVEDKNYNVFDELIQGTKDGINFSAAIDYFVQSNRLKRLFANCFILNGLLFLGSIFMLDYLAPKIFGQEQLENGSVWFIILYEILKNVLWLFPLYLVSFFLSSFWHNDIGAIAYEHTYKETAKKSSKNVRKDIEHMVIDAIYKMPILMFLLIETVIVGFIPYIGIYISAILSAWVYAFYAFDYVWANSGVFSFKERVKVFEHSWAYMLAFGMPCALASSFFPFFINNGLWAMLFPIFIVLAMRTKPKYKLTGFRLRIFYLAEKLSELLWKCINSRIKQTWEAQQQELLNMLNQQQQQQLAENMASSSSSVDSQKSKSDAELVSSGFSEPVLTPAAPEQSEEEEQQQLDASVIADNNEPVAANQNTLFDENEPLSDVKL